MHPSLKRLLCTIAAFVLLASPSWGGPLLDEPGSSVISGSEMFLGEFGLVKAKVEYAVFAPGAFGSYAPLGSPATYDPSGGSEYVYAYEIFNDQGGTEELNLLTISLLPGVVGINPAIPNTLPISGGVAPDHTDFIPAGTPSSIKWTFDPPGLGLGPHSAILLFTSPFEYEFRDATIVGVFPDSSDGSLLPSPSLTHMPEPSTLVLAVMAAMGLLVAGYIRRRKV